MAERLSDIIRGVYGAWQSTHPKQEGHPDEQEMALFLEHKLDAASEARFKEHITVCSRCAEVVALIVEAGPLKEEQAPQPLVDAIKGLPDSVLEIAVRLRDKAIELISTTGDVLVGQEFIPSAVLRSRSIKEFRDEVTVLKDFQELRVEVKLENRQGKAFDLLIRAREKATQKLRKDVRISMFKGDTELESYLAEAGSVVFEHVLIGTYKVEVSGLDEKPASVLIDVRG